MHMPTPPRLLRRSFLQTVSLLLPVVGATWLRAAAELPARKPNFIFILVDDMSWGDLGCFGHLYAKTPHLDRMAEQGVRFTQFYVAYSVCAPSRSALVTGRMPNKAGKRSNESHRLDPALPNIYNLLKPAGYANGHFGKWHLAEGFKLPADEERHEYKIDEWKLGTASARDGLSAQKTTDTALDFIARHANAPFQMSIWYLWPHLPVNPNKEQVAVYDDMPEVDISRFHPTMQAKYNQIKKINPAYDLKENMKGYLATITEMDKQIGRIQEKLDALKLSENTVLVFSSDNGANATVTGEKPVEGTSTPMWAANAGPYKGGKFSLSEGGIRMPCVVQWKGRIKGGRVSNFLWRTVDWLPTVCALAGVKTDGLALDGQDVSDVLLGAERERKEPIFWQGAVREGKWKLVKNELYDLESDPSEQNNLAGKEPERAERMQGLLQAWLKKK
jgi:N-acetylgalactosamine-6-sulfatase